ncbi:radical SAM family heme chaperone HemW [Rhodopirellula sp. P2]|uniref:radical SAM family heme chaperone HemW n=1 Tax=Rhodopirellula sp. P2 TaxID=2127060 RepID=UPI0023676D19|nr:radical SAM family heme chaperone HemW [Rhodopirellula sp. P2]WDQ17715.1 radical SAM family heme chaperone HemW [Rhodopirellula sp. P2]
MTCVPPGGWPQPQSLYVHVPFCRHRCGYCNFSVIAGRDELQDQYLDAIERELTGISPSDTHRNELPLQTIFLGGGTPTRLSAARLQRLHRAIADAFPIADDAEITAEANPEDITPECLDALQAIGVNRISLGIQSFDADKLQCLERGHDQDTAFAAIEAAHQQVGNVSIDLIFGAPDESLATWQNDLSLAASSSISHVSTYALTFEKGTSFWSRRSRGDLSEADETLELQMYEAAQQQFSTDGWQQYEISSFARESFRCRHNLAYWAGRGWHAVGPGAARFVDGRREVNHRSTTTYLKRMLASGSATDETETITLEQYARELAAFGVRQLDGIDLSTIHDRTSIDLETSLAETLTKLQSMALVTHDNHHLQLTRRGILFADTVATALLSEPE